MTAPSEPDGRLLAAALRGDSAAGEALACSLADLTWTACRRVARSNGEAEEAFREVMAALRGNGFARLKGYDGRAPVRIYAALVVRDLLSERAIKLLSIDAERGWRAFEAFFGEDIRRAIARMLPGNSHQQNRQDAYQSVCESLLKNDHQRLRAYSGRGSPSGFVLHAIENLVIDFVRTLLPRRRLPAAIQRLSEFDQSIFRLIYWERLEADPAALARHMERGGEGPTLAQIAEAIDRVRQQVPRDYQLDIRGEGQTVSLSATEEVVVASGAENFAVPTPEESLVESQSAALLEGALGVLQQVLPTLAVQERLYLQLAIAGRPAREIARVVGCPVEDIHKLAQKVKRRLREKIGGDAAVKRWRLSV